MRSTTLARPLIPVMLAITFGGVLPVEAANGSPREADARHATAAIPVRQQATIGMLAALPGVESQRQSHIGIGKNAGPSVDPLHSLARILDQRVGPDAAGRVRVALQAQPC